jgi:hypothetical protein
MGRGDFRAQPQEVKMSTFGDHTPKQDLLDDIQAIKRKYNLSLMETIVALADIISYLAEYETDIHPRDIPHSSRKET